MRKLAVALFFLFPVIASAQITISPARVAYGTEGQTLNIAGSFVPGNISTSVDFTFTDGGVAEVPATSVSASLITCEIPVGVTGQPGAWAVTVVFVDDTGTRTVGGATLMIFANLPPALNVPEVYVAEATSASGAAVDFSAVVGGFSFVDPPPAPTISCTPASGSTFSLGTTTVTCTATDSFGTTTRSFPLEVVDTTGPVITVPAPFTSTSSTVTYTVSAVDAVDGTVAVSCSPASGTVFPTGTTTVQCSATDSRDNTSFASFLVAVNQATPPTLTLPGNITAFVVDPSATGITIGWDVSADQGATVTCNPASGSFFSLGTTTVTCSATNVFNLTSTGSFTCTVLFDPTPKLILPGTMTVQPTSPSGAVVTYTATATDTVDGTIPVACTPPSGSTFPFGLTVVVCSATNSRGYTTFGTFVVAVIDSTGPVLTLPGNISVPAGPTGPAVVTYTASANDAVDGPVPIDCQPPSGETFPVGTTTVVCRAYDLSGNLSEGTFNITVGDTVPPVITVANVVAEATSAAGAVVVYTATAVDAVDGPVPVTCNPPSGSTFPLGITTVNCSAHDAVNNTATASFTVTVRDTTPPTLHLPSDITVSADANCSAVVTYTATATDLVDGTDPVTCSPVSGSTFALGTATVNCSSTDAHNNTATGSFHVIVQDTTPPTIRSITPTPSNIWPENHKMVDVTLVVDVVDNCDTAPVSRIVSVAANQPILGPGSGNTTPDWIITGDLTIQLRAERTNNQDRIYTLTVTSTDASGNVATSTVQVFVHQANNGN